MNESNKWKMWFIVFAIIVIVLLIFDTCDIKIDLSNVSILAIITLSALSYVFAYLFFMLKNEHKNFMKCVDEERREIENNRRRQWNDNEAIQREKDILRRTLSSVISAIGTPSKKLQSKIDRKLKKNKVSTEGRDAILKSQEKTDEYPPPVPVAGRYY
jgi:hypothetical protein